MASFILPANTGVAPAPTVSEVEQIGAIGDPVLRNVCITQCYCELSKAFAQRTGNTANWCTFATWASKQAGVSIRGEDLQRTIEGVLKQDPVIQRLLLDVSVLAQSFGSRLTLENLHQTLLAKLAHNVVEKASDAVARGNRKVFVEIAHHFARFLFQCANDAAYNETTINAFLQEFKNGNPPDGQDYLKSAFRRYYASFFKTDQQGRQEMQFLSNVEIGFHEQNRLQPEIAEALNAALVDPQPIKDFVSNLLQKDLGLAGRVLLLLARLRGKQSLLFGAIDRLIAAAGRLLHNFITAELMTLTIPPDQCLRLGKDLQVGFAAGLRQLHSSELIAFLSRVDPTADSLRDSGATDWSLLTERLHYIVDLFRCFHENPNLFSNAFSDEQVAAMKGGKRPGGRL